MEFWELVSGGYSLMEADMGCPKCGRGWQFIDGALQCPVDHILSPFQPVMSHNEALQKYQELLSKCQDLVQEEISLNNFKIFIEGVG